MAQFLDKDFLLHSDTARMLYHQYAAGMPVIDYHNHLSAQQIAEDTRFDNITQAWLSGDHYKWRAMRTNGVPEEYCTGQAGDRVKFRKWAETVPYTLRNPLYHWTHLELQRYFNIDKLLSPATADAIYDQCSALLKEQSFSVRNLLRKMNVKLLCTTDDPVDDLRYHQQIQSDGFEIKVLPAFRPDHAMAIDNKVSFGNYITKLEKVTGFSIRTLDKYLEALHSRHDYFAQNGCVVSDHGLEQIFASDFTEAGASKIFEQVYMGNQLSSIQVAEFKSFMLTRFAEWDHEKGWVQQYHLGSLRNNNSRLLQTIGPDTGWDSIGDFTQGSQLSKFLDRLDLNNKLTKTILYNLNPADNELMAAMAGNFNDGSFPGKIQYGSAWWFMDQKDGMTRQINALSNLGLLSRFIGMLTDSRSFLSFPRHEYFRRILCNIFGDEIEQGELPADIPWTGKIIQDICFNNARNYFGWELP
jgi:glucuronate isomerase